MRKVYLSFSMIIILLIGTCPQTAHAQLTATITQITNTTGGFIATGDISINADGTRIAFASSRNLTGSNADNNREIFLFDTTTGTFTQITNTTIGGSGGPSISADGTRIAFHFGRQAGGGADENFELFLFDTTTGTFTQITNTSRGDSFLPSINANGTRIAFHSDSNLTGGNTEGSVELFLFNTIVQSLTQVTNTGRNSTSPSINFNGTRIAFESDADLVSGGNTDGNIEIFLFDTTTGTFTQITNTARPTNMRSASINADGTRIAFHSETNSNIFLFDTAANSLRQITNTSRGNSFLPSINADGTRIAFASDADLVSGGNTDGNIEIFLFDTTAGTFTQITNSVGVVGDVNNSASPAINADGTRIAFASDADLVSGGNTDGNGEIFLAVLSGLPPRPIGTTFGPPSSSNPSGTFAEPVNTATGNYFFQRTDLTLPGRGLPVIFTRTYNSLDTYSGPLGHNWTHSYNIFLTEQTDGTVIIKQGDGHEEFYSPTESGHYQSRFGGVFNLLVKNLDGTFTLTLKDQTQEQFNPSGKLTRITNRNGNVLRFSYDAEGKLTAITDSVERTVTLSYDIHNRIIQLTDPIERKIRYSYDADGNLVSDTDPNGGMTQYFYDAGHRVIQITDQRSHILLKNSYDTTGRVVIQTNGRGFTTSFAYGVPQAGDTSITDPRGNTTIHTHDAQLRLIKVTDPLGNKITLTYDEDSNRTSITDKNGNITRFTCDARGNVTSITEPLGHIIVFTYDARDNLTSIIDARGFTTTFNYDAKGNLSSVQDALKNITTFAHNGVGQVIKTTDARGNVTRYAYDEQGNLTALTDTLGGITAYTYDGIGRPISRTNPKGHTGTGRYDANGRLIEIGDPLGHVTGFTYDSVGNLVEVTDAKGHKTRYDYDEVNNLTTVTDALGHITRYTYDTTTNRIGLTDANGHTRTYAFDALNRVIHIIDPVGNTTTYVYDAAGNVIAVTDANGMTNTFAYDANNLLTEIAYSDGSLVTYSYDANDNRVSMGDQRGTTTYKYDALDQLIEVTHPDGSVVTYDYDALGNQKSLTYPDGRTAAYDYDSLSRLIDVRDLGGQKTHYSYDAASNLSGITYPNHTTISYRYDAADRLVRVKSQRNDDVLAQFRYSLDELGNRTRMEAGGLTVPERTVSYTYDDLSQLIAEEERHSAGPIKRTEYTYDPVGNRLTMTGLLTSNSGKGLSTGPINYIYDAANRLLQAGDITFTYDKNGNRLTELISGDHNIEYAYDAANRLIQVVRDERAVFYAYDGDGNKIEQTISVHSGVHKEGRELGSTETFRFLNDVATLLPVVLQQDQAKAGRPKETINYVYGLALISEELSRPRHYPQQFFYHSDGLGSTTALTDRAGRRRAEYQYDAWGNLERSFGDVPNRYLFTGQEQDPEIGLYYLRARWYDPTVGRFLTKDPFGGIIELPQSINEYVYTLNNPINFVDPAGRFVHKRLKRAAQSTVGRFVIKTVIAGGITAGLTPFIGPIPAAFVGGAVAEFTDRVISGRPITFECIVGQDITIGGLSGVTLSQFPTPDPLTSLAFAGLSPSANAEPLAQRCGKAVTVPSLAVQGFRKLPRLNTEGLPPRTVEPVASRLTIKAK